MLFTSIICFRDVNGDRIKQINKPCFTDFKQIKAFPKDDEYLRRDKVPGIRYIKRVFVAWHRIFYINKLNKILGLIDEKNKNIVNPEEEYNLDKLKAFLNEEYSAKGRKF